MLRRSIAVRLVLVVAALTTVATSAPENYLLSDTTEGTLGPGPTQITVSANRAAVNNADKLLLEFQAIGSVGDPLIEMPDPALPFRLEGIESEAIQLEYRAGALCARDRDCEASVTVEVPSDSPIDVSVTASFWREGDGRLLLPADRSFSEDATIEVRIGP
jgi:hypothetical protein